MGRLRPPARPALLLLLVAACGADEPPPASVPPPASEPPLFVEITAASGLDFVHVNGFDGSYSLQETVGAGGALFDYDGDGDLDLYLVDGGRPGDGRPNRLYRREATGRYVDRTAVSGAGDRGYGMGAAAADFDGDGDLDLYVTNFRRDGVLRNDGRGGFEALPAPPGSDRWSTSACWADFERDGDLDLYVATYVDYEPPRGCTDRAGRPDYCGPSIFRPQSDLLLVNDGRGGLTEAPPQAGPGGASGRGLGALCADLDGDGWTDIYVANDGEANALWINRGDGTFEDRALALGAALNLMGEPEASMGIAVGDVDGDGDLDLFLSHLDRETNTLYENLGPAGFADASGESATGPPSFPYTGFGTALFDLELDGDLDLLIVNGRVRRGDELAAGEPPDDQPLAYYMQPNLLLVNEGGGRFADRSDAAGSLTATEEQSRGLLVGDLDHDGDLDAVVTNSGGPARLYRNDAPRRGRWIAVTALAGAAGSWAEGARIAVDAGGVSRVAVQTSGSSYLSSMPTAVQLGLGPAERVDRLAVTWPDGRRAAIHDLPVERGFVLRQREAG